MTERKLRFEATKHGQPPFKRRRRKFRFRDALWLTAVVMLSIGWFIDHQKIALHQATESNLVRKAVEAEAELARLRAQVEPVSVSRAASEPEQNADGSQPERAQRLR